MAIFGQSFAPPSFSLTLMPPPAAASFQDMILSLQHYWSAHNCVILQPYDMEMGAGTFHPATFLRSLGPRPWRAAYVQPCRRPSDGRYGDNPNRFQHYYQFQTILKPAPADIQALYLASLQALGIDPQAHDIRFVEDDWESPTLGAWGLGWEVKGRKTGHVSGDLTSPHTFSHIGVTGTAWRFRNSPISSKWAAMNAAR